jgi:hypothetical protein
MINHCKHNQLALRFSSLRHLSSRKARQHSDLLHTLRGIETVSMRLIITSSSIGGANPQSPSNRFSSATTKFRDTKSTCNWWPCTLYHFQPTGRHHWALGPYIRRSLNLIPHHSHIDQRLLDWIRTSLVDAAIWLLRAQWRLCFSWLLFSFSLMHYSHQCFAGSSQRTDSRKRKQASRQPRLR